MSTAKNSQPDLPQVSGADVDAVLQTAVDAADGSSAETLGNITLIHQARLSRMQRNFAELKNAGASTDTLQQAQAAINTSNTRIAQLSALQQQAATPAPTVSPNGWALQGRVLGDSLAPVGQLTVFLVDGNKVWQREYGFAYTDNTGYFLINYPGEGSSKPDDAKSSTAQKSKAKEAAGAPASTPELFLEIANAQRKPIYLASDAFSPALGSTTYQTISLPAGQKPIGDPPAELKSTAIPPREKKSTTD
ncbi:MAG TPA: hypothetical protein VGI45_33285 [Terracidiphilus sp.]